MKISAFPKCYIDEIVTGKMSLFQWIELAKQLDAEGLELYEGFFESLDQSYLQQVRDAIQEAGFEMPMLCCSPDFTNPDSKSRQQAIAHEVKIIEVTAFLGGGWCRVLSGQRYPQVSVKQGIEWVLAAYQQLLPVAREYKVVLAMENHYKDGFWQYPEFAQKKEVFLAIINAIEDREFFGVQYDPSNAIVAGDDPIELLELVKDRVVTMHASDRYLAEGVSLAELRQSDGTLGYSPHLRHGVVGQGLNDYDTIFRILAGIGYRGWVSIEDGMNGMAEMQQSIDFLKHMRAKYFPDNFMSHD
jgi:sugar phosphate isomerase/epimerase